MVDTPWYEKGLSFKCTGCGKCCTGSPGYVWLEEEEITSMAKALNISKEDFLRLYTRNVGGRVSLLEKGPHYDCIFLQGKMCTIYAARPKQCKTFPWWKDNLASPKDWEETSQRCEGINHPEAPLISLSEIEKHKNS